MSAVVSTKKPVYQDGQIIVEVGINAHEDFKKNKKEFKYDRELLNCIKITASEGSHFLQFVTRQVPDLFTYQMSDGVTVKWLEDLPHYVKDGITPYWKVDATDNSKNLFL